MDRRIEIAKEIISRYGFLYRCSFPGDSSTEGKVCLRMNDSKWHLYYVERGRIYDEKIYDDENTACVKLIVNAILDKEMHLQAIEEYYETLIRDTDPELRNSTMRFLVLSEALKAVSS